MQAAWKTPTFDGVTGSAAVRFTANSTAAAAPMPGALVEAERHQQQVAGQPLERPGRELHRPSAHAPSLGWRKTSQAAAHLDHRPAGERHGLLHALEAGGLAPAQQRGRGQHERQQHHGRDRRDHERVHAAAEQADGGEHHRAEDHEREDVEQGLRHERAEHHREAVAHAPEPAGHDEGARRLAEPRRQRGRHQHADHRAAGRVAAAHAGARQGGAQDRVPGLGAQQHRQRT